MCAAWKSDLNPRTAAPVDLDQTSWQQVFQMATVPLFIEDISPVRQAIAEIRASGVNER